MNRITPIDHTAAQIWRCLILRILQSFFDKRYLTGRYFDTGAVGIRWALRSVWCRNILRLARPAPWPMALTCYISNHENISFHPSDLNNFQSPGTYFQNFDGKIVIGFGSRIAPNVGLITSNHKLVNLDEHENGRDIVIGENCWIGMNAVILPGVTLGPKTVVAAGAVVADSYPAGHAIIGGVPAKVLKNM